jgi:cytochrome P450
MLIIGELFLGKSFNALAEGVTTQFLHDIDCQFQVLGIEWHFPWVYKILQIIPLPSLQHFLHAPERVSKVSPHFFLQFLPLSLFSSFLIFTLETWTNNAIQCGHDTFAEYVGRYGRDTKRVDLLTKIITQPAEKSESALSDYEIGIEIGNLVFAGTDTTSNTLTYLFWELTRHNSWQARLQAELQNVKLENRVVAFKEVANLPVLDAVVNESLRVHPAAPSSLPRETPKEGALLAGYFVPGGVSLRCISFLY